MTFAIAKVQIHLDFAMSIFCIQNLKIQCKNWSNYLLTKNVDGEDS